MHVSPEKGDRGKENDERRPPITESSATMRKVSEIGIRGARSVRRSKKAEKGVGDGRAADDGEGVGGMAEGSKKRAAKPYALQRKQDCPWCSKDSEAQWNWDRKKVHSRASCGIPAERTTVAQTRLGDEDEMPWNISIASGRPRKDGGGKVILSLRAYLFRLTAQKCVMGRKTANKVTGKMQPVYISSAWTKNIQYLTNRQALSVSVLCLNSLRFSVGQQLRGQSANREERGEEMLTNLGCILHGMFMAMVQYYPCCQVSHYLHEITEGLLIFTLAIRKRDCHSAWHPVLMLWSVWKLRLWPWTQATKQVYMFQKWRRPFLLLVPLPCLDSA